MVARLESLVTVDFARIVVRIATFSSATFSRTPLSAPSRPAILPRGPCLRRGWSGAAVAATTSILVGPVTSGSVRLRGIVAAKKFLITPKGPAPYDSGVGVNLVVHGTLNGKSASKTELRREGGQS